MITGDSVTWEEGKQAHLKLSDVAAAEYKGYASRNSATRAYMRFEEDTIATVSGSLTRRERALDVERELDIPHERALKSVLLGVTRECHPEPKSFIVCVLAADRTVDTHKLASILSVEPNHIGLASSEDCERATGFPAGALTPIGMPKGVPVILDASVMSLGDKTTVWCGSGKRTESFVLPLRELVRVAAPSIRDISN